MTRQYWVRKKGNRICDWRLTFVCCCLCPRMFTPAVALAGTRVGSVATLRCKSSARSLYVETRLTRMLCDAHDVCNVNVSISVLINAWHYALLCPTDAWRRRTHSKLLSVCDREPQKMYKVSYVKLCSMPAGHNAMTHAL